MQWTSFLYQAKESWTFCLAFWGRNLSWRPEFWITAQVIKLTTDFIFVSIVCFSQSRARRFQLVPYVNSVSSWILWLAHLTTMFDFSDLRCLLVSYVLVKYYSHPYHVYNLIFLFNLIGFLVLVHKVQAMVMKTLLRTRPFWTIQSWRKLEMPLNRGLSQWQNFIFCSLSTIKLRYIWSFSSWEVMLPLFTVCDIDLIFHFYLVDDVHTYQVQILEMLTVSGSDPHPAVGWMWGACLY